MVLVHIRVFFGIYIYILKIIFNIIPRVYVGLYNIGAVVQFDTFVIYNGDVRLGHTVYTVLFIFELIFTHTLQAVRRTKDKKQRVVKPKKTGTLINY